MKRNRIKKEKVRVCVNLDKEIIEEIDQYITNLSGFINTTLKNYIEYSKKMLNNNTDSDSTRYVKKKKTWNDYNEMKEYMEQEEKRAQVETQAQQEIINLLKKGELPF